MTLLEDKNRDYRRYSHSPDEKVALQARGLQHVLSSNVSAVGINGNNLIIRFHNGSMYSYEDMASSFDRIMNSNSKGKWVWRFLRRAEVPYTKIGTLPLKDDIQATDDELIQLGSRFLDFNDIPSFLSLGTGTFMSLDGRPFNILGTIR